jgi:hypothetical protein
MLVPVGAEAEHQGGGQPWKLPSLWLHTRVRKVVYVCVRAVAYKLGKVTGKDELAEQLHMVLYRRKGTQASRKKDIMDFSGFAFEEEEQVAGRQAGGGEGG